MNVRPVPESAVVPVAGGGYRPEIDGLRALAVVPVILFHAGYSSFSGGYVGVDVFFVISGYLITTIIVHEIAAGTFTVAGFYERRARRILPALTLVVSFSIASALWLMIPGELQDFAESLISVALFVSNFQFMAETGYFATAAELKPLLHTWSLAVEEQYYLVAPLVLVLMSRWRLRWSVLLTAALAIASLAFAQWASRELPDWNFFLTPSRVWELMIGALAAFILLDGRLLLAVGGSARQALSLAGIGLIAAAVFAYDDTLPFPSFYSLAPTLGAAGIILFATPGTLVARILSLGPVVAVGLISYSAYLWHQPLLVFLRLAGRASPAAVAITVASTFVLAWLSWRFVERPFRDRRRLSRRRIFGFAGATAALMVFAGLFGTLGNGLPQRYGEPEQSFFRSLHELSDYRFACRLQMLRSLDFDRPCLIGDATKGPSLAVWGDSHAEALASGLGDALAAGGLSALVFDKGGCLPLAGAMQTGNRQRDRDCFSENGRDLEQIRQSGIKHVILAGRWGDPATAVPFRPANGLGDESARCPQVGDAVVFRAGIELTLCVLKQAGIEVTVMRQVPPLAADPILAMYNRLTVDTGTITFPFAHAQYLAMPGNAILDGLDAARLLDPYPALCDAASGLCRSAEGGVPLYRDFDHVSARGAKLIAPLVVGRLARAN